MKWNYCNIVLYYTLFHYNNLVAKIRSAYQYIHCIVLHCISLYCNVLHCIALCYTMLCHIILLYIYIIYTYINNGYCIYSTIWSINHPVHEVCSFGETVSTCPAACHAGAMTPKSPSPANPRPERGSDSSAEARALFCWARKCWCKGRIFSKKMQAWLDR